LLAYLVLLLVTCPQSFASEDEKDTILNRSLDIAIGNTGLSIGNSRKINGIRINWVDKGVQTVNGINITLWRPIEKYHQNSVNNGIAVGLVSPYANQINGIALGPAAMGGEMNGLVFGIVGAGADEDMNGFAFGGLGAGSGGNANGVLIGGLGAGSGGKVAGMIVGGLGAGAGSNVTGICLGGMGAGCGGSLKGLTIGGLGAGAGGDACGIVIGGLGAGCGETFRGLAFGGIGVGAGNEFQGFGLSLGMTKTPVLKGVAISSYVEVDKSFGLSIALYNNVKELHGVVLGLINYVGNNPKWLRYLPFINFHF
jgi:hypothetical protein